MKKADRYTTVDVLRGLAVVSMIVYHTVWDLVYIFGGDLPFFRSDGAYIWQQSILWTFVLLSGFCLAMGKKKLKRSIVVILCSLVISLVTYIFMPQNLILFGVLSLLGSAMLITALFEKVFCKIPPIIGVTFSFVLFALTRHVASGKICGYLTLPEWLYANNLTAFLGFPPSSFVSEDYVPLLPWIFLFLAGYFIFALLKKYPSAKILSAVHCRPLQWLSRNSLPIYMVHQPVIYAVLFLIFKV